jgi:hypothetical protein
MSKRLFCFWTGENEMPPSRRAALNTLLKTGLEVIFITKENLDEWIVQDDKLHHSYANLSAIHRADYLRMYFMHHYGGGYCDIKNNRNSWLKSYDELYSGNKLAVGYPEIGWKGVAMVGGFEYIKLIINSNKLIGNCAYIFKSKTKFTTEWHEKTTGILDFLSDELARNPANHPEDFRGKKIGGVESKYPLHWSQLLGDIFHPLCYKYKDEIIRTLPTPDFLSDYDH